jgi:hypothetical protein
LAPVAAPVSAASAASAPEIARDLLTSATAGTSPHEVPAVSFQPHLRQQVTGDFNTSPKRKRGTFPRLRFGLVNNALK